MKCPNIIKEAVHPALLGAFIGSGAGGFIGLHKQRKRIEKGLQPPKYDINKLLKSTLVGAGLGAVGGAIGLRTKPVTNISKLKKIPAMKAYIQRETAQVARHKARVGLKPLLKEKGIYTYPTYLKEKGKLLAGQSGQYFREIGRDIAHPIKSLQRQRYMITHGMKFTGKGKLKSLYKRSPVGTLAMGGVYWGTPTYYGASEMLKRDSGARGKLVGLTEIGTMATPKMLPYYAATSLPNLLFKKKKSPLPPDRQAQLLTDTLTSEELAMRLGLRMKP